MKWLTNVHKDDQLTIGELKTGDSRRCIIIGRPRETKEYSVVKLEAMNIIGVYDLYDCEW